MNSERIEIGGGAPLCSTVFSTPDQRFQSAADGHRSYSATMNALSEFGQELSIGVDILQHGWTRQRSDDWPVSLYYGDVRLRSTGEGTRRLADAWASKMHVPRVTPDTEKITGILDAVAFEYDPGEMSSAGFRGKLWVGEDEVDHGCQVFLHILPGVEQAWFGEKSRTDSRKFVEWLMRLG